MDKAVEKTSSPLPKEKVEALTGEVRINFYAALKELAAGQKITKDEWANTSVYGHLKGGIVTLHKDDDKDYNWMISDGDLTGIDWYIVK